MGYRGMHLRGGDHVRRSTGYNGHRGSVGEVTVGDARATVCQGIGGGWWQRPGRVGDNRAGCSSRSRQ